MTDLEDRLAAARGYVDEDGEWQADPTGAFVRWWDATEALAAAPDDGLRAALYRAIGSLTDVRIAEWVRAAGIPLHGHAQDNLDAARYIGPMVRSTLKVEVDAALAAETPQEEPR